MSDGSAAELAARPRSEYRGALSLLAVLAACSTDTTGLERRDPEGEAGIMDAGAGGAGGGAGASGAAGGGGTEAPPSDQLGAFTIVHGVVDGGNLFICLRDASTREPLAGDVPQPLGGLPYASAYRVDLGLLERDVEVELIALAPARAEGATCSGLALEIDASLAAAARDDAGAPDAGADAGGPAFPLEPLTPRRAASVSVATESIRAGAEHVLVAAGCATPAPPAGQAATEGCGAADALFGAYSATTLVELGREPSQPAPYFGLQFLNASRAIGSAEVMLQGQNQTTQSVRLASVVPFGALRPRAVTSVLEPVGVELRLAGGEGADYVQTWEDTLAQSSEGALEPGKRYALVYVGPLPSTGAAGFAPPRFVLIPRR